MTIVKFEPTDRDWIDYLKECVRQGYQPQLHNPVVIRTMTEAEIQQALNEIIDIQITEILVNAGVDPTPEMKEFVRRHEALHANHKPRS